MKILFVETGAGGHHPSYLHGLLEIQGIEAVVYTAEAYNDLPCKQVIHEMDWSKKSFLQYARWINEVSHIAEREQVSCIHFLDGDTIMRYFGWGIGSLYKWKVIVTFHGLWIGWFRISSYRAMLRGRNRVGVVHTKFIEEQFGKYGINNVRRVEYPVFAYKNLCGIDSKHARDYYHIATPYKVFGILGSEAAYKGMDTLIDAVSLLRTPIAILIAGNWNADVLRPLKSYADDGRIQLFTQLHTLSQQEYEYAIGACDFILLPYKKYFNGASGPLAEGVVADKIIVGSNHGSIGQIIENNVLGYSFDAERPDKLADAIERALSEDFVRTKEYVNYQQSLSPDYFRQAYLEIYEGYGNVQE